MIKNLVILYSYYEKAEVIWLQVNHDLKRWIDWSEECQRIGLVILDGTKKDIENIEVVWKGIKDYWECTCARIKQINSKFNCYIILAQQMEKFYGIDMVRNNFVVIFFSELSHFRNFK